MLETQFRQEVQHKGKRFFFLSVSFLCKLDTTALYEIFSYGDSFDVLISSSTVLCSGLFFSLLHITFKPSSLALLVIKSRKVFISASFIQLT